MANHILLERIELNSSAASVVFNNIPQSGYTDLKIVCSSRTSRTSDTDAIKIRFNGSSSSYTNRVIYGSGSGVASFAGPTDAIGNAYTASDYLAAGLFGNQEFYVANYAGSSYKSVSVESVQEANTTYAEMDIIAGLWSDTAAITSITILPNVGGSLSQYSTFSLYGLAAVGSNPQIAPYASGGNITTDGTYWYHTFINSGSFVPSKSLSCDYLVIAGGGAGGGSGSSVAGYGGGGGAGGYRSATSQSLSSSNSYTITVGSGGAPNTSGSNSQISGSGFTTFVSTGGGFGGNATNIGRSVLYDGASGGSGGGAGNESRQGGLGNTPSTSPSQGNNGGAGYVGPNNAAGSGGGGAGGAGGQGSNNGAGGAGGAGSNSFSTWASATLTGVSGYYAGGGGGGVENDSYAGGAGGSGGGGKGDGNNGDAVAGTANTGSGGGGGGPSSCKPGGSGIVIIRYAI
jgi:hypothetical protein